jgi:hypothetical protein
MFCPSCGFEYTQKTNFCKRCGEELNAAPRSAAYSPQRFHATGMFFVVAMFGILGLFLNLLSFHVLLSRHVSSEDAFLTFKLGLLLVGGIAGFLIRQMSRLITANQKSNQAPAQERVIIKEAQVPRLGMTNDPVQGVGEPHSVVEHTTRQMAGGYGEPKMTE